MHFPFIQFIQFIQFLAFEAFFPPLSSFSCSLRHWVLGLEIYTDLTADMQPSSGPSMSRQNLGRDVSGTAFWGLTLPQKWEVNSETPKKLEFISLF